MSSSDPASSSVGPKDDVRETLDVVFFLSGSLKFTL